MDNVYEFQTAMISEKDKIFDYVERIKSILRNNSNVLAMSVPVLPGIITKQEILTELNSGESVVVGIEKDNLSIVKYSIKNNYTNLFLTNDLTLIPNFINPLINQIIDMNYFDPLIINAEGLNIEKNNCMYCDNNFDDIFTELANYIESFKTQYQHLGYDREKLPKIKPKLCVFVGFSAFKNNLNTINSTKLGQVLEKGKDLGLINFIIIDSVEKLRMLSYESWYKTVVVENKGIFIGSGVTTQMVIRITNNDRRLNEELPHNFCYVIEHGKAKIVKYVEEYKLN